MSTSGGSSGGSSFPDYTGSGSPEGVKTAAVGKSYGDTTNGALWWKQAGAGNTGWVMGGVLPTISSNLPVPGFFIGTDDTIIGTDSGGTLALTDVLAWATGKTYNSLQWSNSGSDGTQNLTLQLGTTGQYTWGYLPSGKTIMPGPITTAPTDSHTAIGAFGQVAIGTPKQNTTGYDILVHGNITVTAATAGIINLGVGPTATPTVDPITAAFSTAALEIVGFTAVVPDTYYLSLTTSGTITVGTPVSTATPL